MINEKAILVKLSISQWTARKCDKEVTAETLDRNGAAYNAGRFWKQLVAKNEMDKINTVAGSARTYHYMHTLPWDDGGWRLLPNGLIFEYRAMLAKLKADFESRVNILLQDYDTLRTDAALFLGLMFKSNEYPSVWEVGQKFNFQTEFSPIPTGEDLRLSLNENEIASLKEEILQNTDTKQKAALKNLYQKVYETIAHAVEKLSNPDSIFRDSLIHNIQDLSNLLPALNIWNDPVLIQIAKDIDASLYAYSPDQLREDTLLRNKVAADADAILKKLGVKL